MRGDSIQDCAPSDRPDDAVSCHVPSISIPIKEHSNVTLDSEKATPTKGQHTAKERAKKKLRFAINLPRKVFGQDNKTSRRRMWYIVFVFLVCSYVMCVAGVLTEYRLRNTPQVVLPDLGFAFAEKFTPPLTKWINYPDIAVLTSTAFTFLWLLFDGPKSQKIAVFRRFLTMISLLYLLRSICVLATQLPAPCMAYAEREWSHNLFYEALLVLVRQKSTNGDVFFSGHTVVISSCALVVEIYCKRRWLIWLFWTYSVFSLYVIVASKFHYSIDVVIALSLSLLLWRLYHMAMTVPQVRNYLAIFKFFESDKEADTFSKDGETDSQHVVEQCVQ